MPRRRRRKRSGRPRRLLVGLRLLLRAWARQREAAARLSLVDSLQSQVPDNRSQGPWRGA
ncbi:hypothetical protein CKO21_02300 [Rhodovibrio salinarum]|uniref:Uncharacterized protein n=1 Tax=Rhodovibrio salinarum TaxID=1087 RepID=A0A934QFJ4_9PROT|nr:hypothetical protein [Rhodovibrio salinarum]